MLNNIEKKKYFLEYKEMYLSVVYSALKLYEKTQDEEILVEIKRLGRIYKEIQRGYCG